MDSKTKTKFLIFGTIGIFALLILIIIVSAAGGSNKKEDKKGLSLTAQKNYEQFTINDMMKVNEQAEKNRDAGRSVLSQRNERDYSGYASENSTPPAAEQYEAPPPVKAKPEAAPVAGRSQTPAQSTRTVVQSPAQENNSFAEALALALTSENKKENITSVAANSGIPAVVHGEQKLATGERARLRTTENGVIGGVNIPANTYIYGNITFATNRIIITINAAYINGVETRVTAQAYDISDGGQGIYLAGITEGGRIANQAKGEAGNEAANVAATGGMVGRMAGSVIRTISGSGGETTIILSNNHRIIIK